MIDAPGQQRLAQCPHADHAELVGRIGLDEVGDVEPADDADGLILAFELLAAGKAAGGSADHEDVAGELARALRPLDPGFEADAAESKAEAARGKPEDDPEP